MLTYILAQKGETFEILGMIGRWFSIGRIYRVLVYFRDINQDVSSRVHIKVSLKRLDQFL